MNSEVVQKYTRVVLYWIAGALVSHGMVQSGASWIEPTIGVIMTVVNFAWTIYGGRLNGLLEQVQAKDGVLATNVVLNPEKIDPAAVKAATSSGITANP